MFSLVLVVFLTIASVTVDNNTQLNYYNGTGIMPQLTGNNSDPLCACFFGMIDENEICTKTKYSSMCLYAQ